jgi:hypothetical protein
MDNRQGLAVDGSLTPATGFAEREQALAMATRLPARATLGADKSYDTRDFVDALRGLAVTPHIAQHTTKDALSGGRTGRLDVYLWAGRLQPGPVAAARGAADMSAHAHGPRLLASTPEPGHARRPR